LSVSIAEYALPADSSAPGIVKGPDGNLWFTDLANNIGEINSITHVINLYPIPTANSGPQDITAGVDGYIWFTETNANIIGRINPTTDKFDEFHIKTAGSSPFGITEAPDGNIWFTEQSGYKIGEINTFTQAISEFPISRSGFGPTEITNGPFNDPWFIEGNNNIGYINPISDAITEFTVPGNSGPFNGITTSPDGNLWVTSYSANAIVRIDPVTHDMTEFHLSAPGSDPYGITLGPGGDLWFTEPGANQVGQIDPTTGHIDEFKIPTSDVAPMGITTGPQDNLWFAELGHTGASYQIHSNIGEVILSEGNPDLKISGTAPSSVPTGSNVTYQLTVSNNGTGPATGVKLSDALPSGATFVSATGGVTPVDNELTFTIGNLAAGASNSISIVVTPGVPGMSTDNGRVSMDQIDLTPGDNSVMLTTNVVSAGADLELTGTAPMLAGIRSDVTYTFTVKNDGGAEATGVKLADPVPSGAVLQGVSGGTKTGSGSNLVILLGRLAPGASATVTVVVLAPKPVLYGLIDVGSVSMDQKDPSPADNSVTLDTTLVGTQGTGCQHSATVILLRFAEPVDPAWAKNVDNYQLVDREESPRTIRLKSARYNARSNTVTLKPLHQPNMHDLFQLTVLSAGARGPTDAATSPAGGPSGSGGPPGNLVIMIGIQDLVTRGTSPTDLRNYKWLLAKQTAQMKRLGLE
jgi:virginiamycin B lyase